MIILLLSNQNIFQKCIKGLFAQNECCKVSVWFMYWNLSWYQQINQK